MSQKIQQVAEQQPFIEYRFPSRQTPNIEKWSCIYIFLIPGAKWEFDPF